MCSSGKGLGILEKEVGTEKYQNWRIRTGGGVQGSLKKEERQIACVRLDVCLRVRTVCICMLSADNISLFVCMQALHHVYLCVGGE